MRSERITETDDRGKGIWHIMVKGLRYKAVGCLEFSFG